MNTELTPVTTTFRRRASDILPEDSKTLGQIAFEFMAERMVISHGIEYDADIGSMRWENQAPNVQKDWEDCAQQVVSEFKVRVVNL